MPPEIERSCELAVLAEGATLADLEVAYLRRGEQLLQCDAARALAVKIIKEQNDLRENTYR